MNAPHAAPANLRARPVMTNGAPEPPVLRWRRRQVRCGDCGAVYEATSCPSCGERPGGAPVEVTGLVIDRPGGTARLRLVEVLADGRHVEHGTRPLTVEQLRWLRRPASWPTAGEVAG